MSDVHVLDDFEGDEEEALYEDEEAVEEEWMRSHDLDYLKFMFDGAATLNELSASLRELADHYDEMDRQGCRLEVPVDGGHATIWRPDGVPSCWVITEVSRPDA